MLKRTVMCIVGLVAILGVLVMGCGGGNGGGNVTIPDLPIGLGRPYLDEIIITRQPVLATGISRLSANTTQLFATGIATTALFNQILADANLVYNVSYGTYTELTFNPVGPVHPVGNKLNPFAYEPFREAFNWLINREYIAGTIMGGLGQPRYTVLNPNFADAGTTARYKVEHDALVANYQHNITRAKQQIYAAMLYLNSTGAAAGRISNTGNETHPIWWYNNGTANERANIHFLIRTEDERLQVGQYVDSLVATELGFTTTKLEAGSGTLGPIWLGDPAANLWHVYTGGWVSTVISRDEGWVFGGMYTNLWASAMGALWAAYGNNQTYFPAAEKLWNNNFSSMAERKALFLECMNATMKDSVRVFVATRLAAGPYRKEIRLATDAAGGSQGSWVWALTAHYRTAGGTPIVGGLLRVDMVDLLADPWNPIAGSNWVFDMFPIRATGDMATQPDTRDGLRWPQRIEKAEVFMRTGYPVGVTGNWCTLNFTSDLAILNATGSAWCDWDATTQTFITVTQKTTVGNPYYDPTFNRTAVRFSRVYYPTSVWNQTLHDGSKLSMGDFILGAILTFDRAKNTSAIFDPASVSAFNAFIGMFRGVRFITTDPNWGLIVETWSNVYSLDAEATAQGSSWWPNYAQGPGMWHTLALAIRAEAQGSLAFGSAKARAKGCEWTSFIAGPSLTVLKNQLAWAGTNNYLPYRPTMELFVTPEEITERYTNLKYWVYDRGRNHFWVASGPFYLHSVNTLTKEVILRRHVGYQDPPDRYLFLLNPLT